MPGEIAKGRFVLLQPLGEGSQGVTFDGVDKREGRPVAIKRFDVRGAKAWKDVELAEREARVLQSLEHPHLPAYIDHFEEDGALYLVMEKIEGESLAAARRRGGAFGEEEATRFLRDASRVLDYLHGRVPPVIHRDLKPGNVLRRPDGSFAFVDFGSVRDRLRVKGGSTVVGTFGYMAPEQMQGRAMPASDVYAIGATALSMLTGSEPEDLPHKGLAIDVRRALRGAAVSERLVAVLERMLDPDPDTRASRIAPLLAGTARTPRRKSDPHQAWRDDHGARKAERQLRHAARRVEHAARRAARRAQHAAQFEALRHLSPRHRLPGPLRVLFMIGLVVGMVAVGLATRIIVPAVLGLLSLFIARRALIAASRAVQRGGHVAIDGMKASRRWVSGGGVERDDGEGDDGEGDEGPYATWTPDERERGPRVNVEAERRARVAGDRKEERDANADEQAEREEEIEQAGSTEDDLPRRRGQR